MPSTPAARATLCSGAWQRHSVEKALQGKENVQAAAASEPSKSAHKAKASQHKSSAAAHGTAASAAAKNIGK